MIERTSRKDDRPLLKDKEPVDVFQSLIEKRYPVYEKADIVIESHNGPSEAILNQLIDKMHRFLRYDQRKTG
jgi:shikimate kinase